MSVARFNIRAAVAGDVAACATTAHAAHARVSAVHNFPSELPTLEIATRFIRSKLENPRCRDYVAEKVSERVCPRRLVDDEVLWPSFLSGRRPRRSPFMRPLNIVRWPRDLDKILGFPF